jgi:hypothetical protein
MEIQQVSKGQEINRMTENNRRLDYILSYTKTFTHCDFDCQTRFITLFKSANWRNQKNNKIEMKTRTKIETKEETRERKVNGSLG